MQEKKSEFCISTVRTQKSPTELRQSSVSLVRGLDIKHVSLLYLFCNLYVAMLFLNVRVLLPVAVAVGVTQEEHIECLSDGCEHILRGNEIRLEVTGCIN